MALMAVVAVVAKPSAKGQPRGWLLWVYYLNG